MRRTKEQAAETRQALLDAALRVFSRQGYAATRLEDVAQEAGVTRGAIYWHFKSKADLYNTLVAEVSLRSDQVVSRARAAADGSTLDMLRRIMVGLLEFTEEDEQYRAVMELTVLKTEVTPELEEGMRLKVEGLRSVEQTLVKAIRLGQQSGEIRADLEPIDGARAYMAYLNGAILIWLLDQRAFSLKAEASRLADVYIRGIAAHPAAMP
jgi:AcrR family transcriptional regulator